MAHFGVSPRSVKGLIGRGEGRRNHSAEAIARYHEAVRIKPDFAQAHYNWGIALTRQGKTIEASERLQQATQEVASATPPS